jgi:hypothetical protein
MSKKNNNHRKEKKNNPDSGNGPFGAPVEQDGNNEHNNENERSKEASTFEISIGWKLEAERRAWLAALNEDVSSDSDIMMDVV